MHRFTEEYDTPEAYILGITARIWEGRGVGLIRRYYTPDVVMHTGAGDGAGVEAVVAGTLATLHEFPDRVLLGEDVIWSQDTPTDCYSSHRIVSTMQHRNEGMFGPATGRAVQVRTVADCLVRDGRICEEWLVRDQAAIALQLGLSPAELGARAAEQAALAGEGEGFAAAALARWSDARAAPALADDGSPAAACAAMLARVWNDADLSQIAAAFDRAAMLHLPAGALAHGHAGMDGFVIGYLASFPDSRLVVQHAITRYDPGKPVRVALRWVMAGTHTGRGRFGAPTGVQVVVPGILHAELSGARITRAFMLVDELAVWTALAAG